MNNERIIGLDVGTKRIGIAISDPLMFTAQPLKTITRIPEAVSLETIDNICKEYNIISIVVGLPKNMNGTIGPQAEDCQNYAQMIKKKTGKDIIFEDERLTSKQAERFLATQNKKYTKNKGLIDVASAAIILQQYLDRRSLK